MQSGPDVDPSLAAKIEQLLPQIYVIATLLICTFLTVLTPPFFVPDEQNHAQRELQIAHGEWIGHSGPNGAGALMDTNLIEIIHRVVQLENQAEHFVQAHDTHTDGRVSESALSPIRALRWSRKTAFNAFANTAVYPPTLYLPAVLGWKIAEAANLTIVHSLLLARLTSALCAIGIGWFALRYAGRDRWLLFAFLLLPTDLSLSASCSQDALMAPLLALAVVLLFRATSEHRLQTRLELALTTALLTACTAARPPYLPLVFLLLLPALELDQLRSRKTLSIFAAILVSVGLVGLWQLSVRPLGLWIGPGASPAQQLAFLKSHPIQGSSIIAASSRHELPSLIFYRFALLGRNDVNPSKTVYPLMVLSLLGILLSAPQMTLRRWQSSLLVVTVLFAIVTGISLIEYIIWTPPGSILLEGLQTRYYLPLVPIALLCVSPLIQPIERIVPARLRQSSLVLATALLLFVCYTPWLAAHRFYRTSLSAALRAGIS